MPRFRFIACRPGLLLLSTVVTMLCGTVASADGLRVSNATEVAYAVVDLSTTAEDMGLSQADLVDTVTSGLVAAGIKARPTIPGHDEEVLLVDVVVADDTFYVSLGFWRVASYSQPGGGTDSDFVTVWQDYAVGAHHGNLKTIRQTMAVIVDRFVGSYSEANGLPGGMQANSQP